MGIVCKAEDLSPSSVPRSCFKQPGNQPESFVDILASRNRGASAVSSPCQRYDESVEVVTQERTTE